MNRALPETLTAPQPGHGSRAPLRTAILALLFVASYLALDWVSYIHPLQRFSITPWNPQPALAIALLVVAGRRWLPAVFAAVVLAEWLVRMQALSAPALLVGAVLTLGYAAMAHALTRRFAIDRALRSQRDATRLVLVVGAGALGTGVLYVAALAARTAMPLGDALLALVHFWIGDAVGILVTLPFVLMLTVPERRLEMSDMLRRPEALWHALGMLLALGVLVASPAAEQVRLFYILFLPIILMAARFGMVGGALAAVVIQGAVVAAGVGIGFEALTMFELQSLLIALTVTGLLLGVSVDERRRVEAELRRTMRLAAAGEMAAALAHELNQPLTALATYARASQLMLQGAAADPAVLDRTLGKLVGEANRAAEVVRRLRDFFRAGATQLAPMSLRDVAERTVQQLRPQAEQAQATLEVQAPLPLPHLLADQVQIEVVLRNLVANAIEAAGERPPPREVRLVLARADASTARLEVHDSGNGVRPEDASRIFEPFETSRAHGIGMGLAISRAIVEAHGGELWAEPGPRGLFCMTLPLKEAALD